jgi:ATP-binding cassette subfamily C (CFTR/MRP) protein 1
MRTAVARLLIHFIKDRSQLAWRGYVYTALMFIVAFVQSMLLHQYFHRCMVVGMRIRTALIAAVYKKVR